MEHSNNGDAIEQRLAALEAKYTALDTQIDATEQALAAMAAAKKTRDQVNELGDRLDMIVRAVNAIACVATGAILLWFANLLYQDAAIVNDRVGDWLVAGGGGCIAYGLLVLTSNENRMLAWLETLNPWRR